MRHRHRIRRSQLLLAGVALLLLGACKHPLEIVGEGDITSLSGTRDCLLEDFQTSAVNCTDNTVTTSYVETYTGTARAGYQFRRWNHYCATSLTNECSFAIPQSLVDLAQGATLPSLQAVFRSTSNTGFTSVFMGDNFFAPLAQGIQAHAIAAGFPDHSSNVFTAAGDLGAPQAMWDNVTERTAIQAVLDIGDVELFGMTYSPVHPTEDGYRLWVDYALEQNPDTRFFIAMPWEADPGSVTSSVYEANYATLRVAPIHALIDSLREAYPGVDFYSLPDGRSAVELYTLLDASNLPDVTGLVGSSADSIFSNSGGDPGDILVALGELVWLGAIYDLDVTNYSHNPGYITDLKALAQSIIDNHDDKYHAPDEVDIDTDGDGIWDRLDPNPSGKLNVLMIMADDLGFNDLAINNGNTNIDTPSMDQIAQEGVRFTRHYGTAVCSPARAALLTGVAPSRLGYLPNGRGIPTDYETLPDRLQAEGYTTWHIGKWHIGHLQRTAWPDYQGFDHWFGFLHQWNLAGTQSQGQVIPDQPRYNDPWLEGDTEPGQHYIGHLENILTDKALEVLTDLHDEQEPWFLNLWFYAPHSPNQPAAEFAQLYPDTSAGRYRALVNQLDTNIGRVLTHLDSLGMTQDTVIVIVSDNGGTNSILDNNYPYFGYKSSLFEGGVRTPLIIKWPDQSMNSQVFGDSISIEDLYPTLLEALNVSATPDIDGVSFFQALQQLQPVPQRDLFWEHLHNADSYSVLSADGRWKLFNFGEFWGAPTADRLYDFTVDPTGTTQESPAPPLQLAQMQAAYEGWYMDAHLIDTSYAPTPNGGGVLTGRDFLRTPGFEGYTIGVGVPDELDGQIVAQAGAWDMSRAGNTVTAQFGSVILSGDITNANACHSVVITGRFRRSLTHISPPADTSLVLVIDGLEVDSVLSQTELIVADPTVPTIVGDPAVSSGNGTIVPPVILNTRLDATTRWTLSDFEQSICP